MKRKNLNQQELSGIIEKECKKDFKDKIPVKKLADAISKKYSQYKRLAREYLENAEQLEDFLIRAEKKLNALPGVGKKLAYVPQMILMVRSYAIGEYKDITKTELVLILAALIYFVSPLDVIPDTFPGVGFIDDVMVAGAIMKICDDEIKTYMDWLKANGKKA